MCTNESVFNTSFVWRARVCVCLQNQPCDCVSWLTGFNIVCPSAAWIGHKSTNPSFFSLFISLYYPLLLLQTPPQHNHILFISTTTPRKPCSKKAKGNFCASLFNGERIGCNDQIGLLLWNNVMNAFMESSTETSSIFLFAHLGGSTLCSSDFYVQNTISAVFHMQMTK